MSIAAQAIILVLIGFTVGIFVVTGLIIGCPQILLLGLVPIIIGIFSKNKPDEWRGNDY